MNELAAATAVVAMSIDANAEKDSELGSTCTIAGIHATREPFEENSSMDINHHHVLPEDCEAGAAIRKVAMHIPLPGLAW